ncbi:hypothetical protein M2451_004112 [Dysgonomonas sp. PFB1-18]|uniref:hypothetical protein n=1 Tax=unclassified Dysgonomonas TaxID=2630389 RepID=UPI0024771560|nr:MULTISPECIES: hypothetical protein [unclassified Dysgonomonas]MDH6311181.1 hypothetical protein [Dysgonomonas sp. PF1-14]MDH6341065.1 hypothetical protein [Dysgonomonas sp. PF1-16]MDH6382762.1 hypothetical protein [Dysgonomonas sp. PFB1-18]MDH6400053.1 hypothetical protein [Dysgonomonas sp. PF1-23]
MSSYENKHLKFDTVKIRTNKEYLINTFIKFNSRYNTKGDLINISYNSKDDKLIPYNLYIGINDNSQTLTLEFSSKILLDDYPKLITKDTFRQCLKNINQLSICTLDVDSIASDCHFSKVHVTNDIKYELNDNVLNSLNSCVNNYRRFKWERYRNGGIRFNKDVKTKTCKESIVIYDKEKEIIKNEDFLSILNNPNDVINYFDGVTRFEMELETPNKICNALNIDTTHISKIFKSMENPLHTQFNKIFGERDINNKQYITNYETYAMNVIIEKHNGDIKKIEQEMKDQHIYSSNSRNGLSERMKKIKTLIQQRNEQLYNYSGILTEIRQKLSE